MLKVRHLHPASGVGSIGNAHVLKAYNEKNIADYSFSFNNEFRNAKRIIIHPDYNAFSGNGLYDLVLVELDQEIANVRLPTINDLYDEVGDTIIAVGYGYHGVSTKPNKLKSKQKKLAGENIVDSIACNNKFGVPSILYCDFDSPENTINGLGSNSPCRLEYIVASGDSGGGVFRLTKNSTELLGIVHGGGVNPNIMLKTGSYYGQLMELVRVSAYSSWINDIIKQ